MGLIVDSTVLIASERRGLNASRMLKLLVQQFSPGNEHFSVSVISVAELAHGLSRADSDKKRIVRQRFLDDLLHFAPIIPINAEIAIRAGLIDGHLVSDGTRIGFADVLIAATALELGYGVVTANVRHFERIPLLRVEAFS